MVPQWFHKNTIRPPKMIKSYITGSLPNDILRYYFGEPSYIIYHENRNSVSWKVFSLKVQAFCWEGFLYLFGGEWSSRDQKRYRDLSLTRKHRKKPWVQTYSRDMWCHCDVFIKLSSCCLSWRIRLRSIPRSLAFWYAGHAWNALGTARGDSLIWLCVCPAEKHRHARW